MRIDTARSKLKSQETRFHKQELKMRAFRGIAIAAGLGGGIALMTTLSAQPPGPPNRDRGGGGQPADPTSYIARLMSFDKNQDGQLSKDEITDSRLVALFERADANADGIVTKEELTADFNQEIAKLGAEGQGGGPGGGGGLRGGPPGPGGGGGFPGGGGGGRGERRIGGPGGPGFPGGPGGPGGPGMGDPPPIGQVLPQPIQGMLRLSNLQKKKLDALQKHVDQKLAEILTEDQKHQLEDLKGRRPGGP